MKSVAMAPTKRSQPQGATVQQDSTLLLIGSEAQRHEAILAISKEFLELRREDRGTKMAALAPAFTDDVTLETFFTLLENVGDGQEVQLYVLFALSGGLTSSPSRVSHPSILTSSVQWWSRWRSGRAPHSRTETCRCV
jgi:hypothetical protein